MFVGTPLGSNATSPTQTDSSAPECHSEDQSCSASPLSAAPHSPLCWALQAQEDLAQAEEELQRIQVRHTTETEAVKRGVERAILGARREERRLLERVEQDHRDTQQRLEQVQKENMAAARVSQTLLDQRSHRLTQLRQQVQQVSETVLKEKGLNYNLLLQEIADFLQPWEISVALKKVNFKPSSQPNVVTFGDIRVQEQRLCLNVGGCGANGKLCALHSQEMQCEAITQCSKTENNRRQEWTSPTGRGVRKISPSNRSQLELDEQSTVSAKIHSWLPKCDQSEWELYQDDEMESGSFQPEREDVSLGVPPIVRNIAFNGKEQVDKKINENHYSPRNHRKLLSVATNKKQSLSPEQRRGSIRTSKHKEGDVDKGSHDLNNSRLRHVSSSLRSPRLSSRNPLGSQSCLDLSSRGHSRLSQSSDEHSLGTVGDSGRAPSPADSLDSTYTFIVSPSHDCGLNKGSLKQSFHLSKSAVDLTLKTRPLIKSGMNQQGLCNIISRGSWVSDMGPVLSYPTCLGHNILSQYKEKAVVGGSKQAPVKRSLSMTVIDGSNQEPKQGRGDRRVTTLRELEEEVDPLFTAFNPSGVHLTVQFGRQGSGRADLTLPSGIHATPQGHLFIVDCGNARVQVTDHQGNVLQQVTSPNNDGCSRRCRNYFDIAVNAKGLIAMSCAAERALLVFSRHGRLLQSFGGSCMSSAKDDLEAPRGVTVTRHDEFLVADIRKGNLIALKLDHKTGSRLERTVVTGFHRPYLVAACLSSGIVAVSERGNETGYVPCIKVLEPNWNTVRVLGVCAGMGPVLTCPWGICIDKEGNVLVTDWGEEHRIVLYPTNGVGWPIVNQGLSSPRGLTLLPDGQLAVSDSMHHCIKIYRYNVMQD